MDEAGSGRRSDLGWYLASRIGALAIAITSIAILVTRAEQDATSKAQALAAHRALLEQRLRKPKLAPAPEARGYSAYDALTQPFLSGSKSGFGGLGLRGTGRMPSGKHKFLPSTKAGPPDSLSQSEPPADSAP